MIMIRIPYILEIRDTIQNAKATAIIVRTSRDSALYNLIYFHLLSLYLFQSGAPST